MIAEKNQYSAGEISCISYPHINGHGYFFWHQSYIMHITSSNYITSDWINSGLISKSLLSNI